jgi:L-ascorbate metabolism protein UlaG (beta-lactamase superfamily)
MLNSQIPPTKTVMEGQPIVVRINGTLPDISTLGSEEKSERAAEVKRQGISTNTSCSLFARIETDQKMFHVLVDIGQGIVKSIEKGPSELGFNSTSANPDAVLITHSHDDHIKELPVLVNKVNDDESRKHLKIFCTMECRDQIIKRFPQLSEKTSTNNSRVSFNIVQPDETFEVGPFSVMPILADHGDNSPAGSVIYMVKLLDTKIIIGWDFLSLPNVNENLLWKPDLLILGTQSYNPHPQTGMISVTDAYDIVRRWNAKTCYIVHYRGLLDFEEASNQWFRGPVKAMTTEELQSVIDAHLQVTGDNGKFTITVAKEGMVWTGKEQQQQQHQVYDDESAPIGNVLEIESLQKYILKIENMARDHKLKLMVEDTVNRFNFEFIRPSKDRNGNDDILYAEGEKGMMAKGPQLRMEIVPSTSQEESSTIRIKVSRGKKDVFKDDIYVSNIDAQRVKRFIKENFVPVTPTVK